MTNLSLVRGLLQTAVLLICFSPGPAAVAEPKQGDALLKTDLMGIFAHPDDETGMAATLATIAADPRKTVAAVYCTRGEGGGNMVGTQAGRALGVLREAELRDCLARLGVRYCYFLDQEDFAYTESLAATLERWGKEETLGNLVRLIRALRPEVILTMNPAPTPGQHGHHQAAGLLATEAFEAAADRKRFPEQLDREGLSVWQVRKLYYGGSGPSATVTVQTTEPLPEGQPAWQIAAEALSNHRSQAFGNFAASPWLRRAQTFRLIKSCVSPEADSDFFHRLPLPDAQAIPVLLAPSKAAAIRMAILSRPAIDRYRQWVQEQKIDALATPVTADVPMVAGERGPIRIEIQNAGDELLQGELKFKVPPGWTLQSVSLPARIAPRSSALLTNWLESPQAPAEDAELFAELTTPSNELLAASARIHWVPQLRVARLKRAPALDGGSSGFEELIPVSISPDQIVQGRVAGAADSSARFRIGHHNEILYLDIEVTDDQVVSNIEPGDIKGHWRSDSVEICFDASASAEHTLDAFKLGIFPFDSTGRVRAARDADANQGPVEKTAPNTRLFSAKTAGGYRIQAAIPFAEAGLRAGIRAGFNLIIYDGDKTDAAPGENINKSRIAWSPRPGVQGRPEDWGRIVW